ncbi:MAG: glutamine amidotransferase [Bacilli bacterium]|nr:glutamine amidotransferase [Bacilli bacterium]
MNIGYIYYDLLNLYGDDGNIKALKYRLSNQGINVNIDYISLGDIINFAKYDIVYFGSSTDDNLLIALNYLKDYKDDIKRYIDSNKFLLATGNSVELFGKYIQKGEEKIEALDILNYYTVYNESRIVNDINYSCTMSKNNIIGFENHRGQIISKEKNFLYKGDNKYGVIHNNFIGTYLLGPMLIRNPYFMEDYIKRILNKEDIKEDNYNLEIEAYKKAVELLS